MRKNMQRIMSIMLVLFLLIPSLVIADTSIDIDYTQKGNNAIVNIKGVRNRPVSITIKDESRYHYMNQGVTDDLGKIEFKATLDLDKTYECQVNIDGETATKNIFMKESGIDPEPDDPTDPGKPKDARVDLYIKGYKGVILDEKNIKIRNRETALDLTTRILDDNDISYENRKGYIASIDGQKEFDKGQDSGWMFSVNGKFPDVGAGSVRLKDGDKIKWLYTHDLGEDIGVPSYKRDSSNAEVGNKIISEALKIVEAKLSTEKDIKKAVEDIVKYFENNKSVSKAKEIRGLLKDGSKSVEVLSIALDRVKTESLAAHIGNGAVDIVKVLNNAVDSKAEKDIIEKLSQVSEEHLGIALNSISKIKDKKNIDTIIENILETSIKVEEKLYNSIGNTNKNMGKSIRIKIVEPKADNGEIILPKPLLEKAISKKIDNMNISSKLSSFELAPEFIGKDIKYDIKINLEKNNNITSIKFIQGDKELNKLQKPIKIILSYDTNINSKNNITTVLIKEDGSKEIIGGIYDESTKTIKFITNKSGKFTIEENAKEFNDTLKYKWAEEAIESMAAKRIIGGKTKDKFDPASSITRAEFSALVSRMLKYDEDLNNDLPFKDVNKVKWYYKSISAAYKNGLINGKSSSIFDPEGYITREEMSKIIGQILEDNNYKKQDKKGLGKFTDKDSIASWAEEGAAIIVHNEIIKGVNGKFNPKENATRAETAVMLHRLYELIMD